MENTFDSSSTTSNTLDHLDLDQYEARFADKEFSVPKIKAHELYKDVPKGLKEWFAYKSLNRCKVVELQHVVTNGSEGNLKLFTQTEITISGIHPQV